MKNTETYEFLDYPREQVDAALAQLGYSSNDPEFPDSIVEEIEAVLEAVGGAVSHQQQLQSADSTETQQEAIVPQDAGAIAAEATRILNAKHIQTDPKVLLTVIQARINQSIKEARAVNQVGREAFAAELDRGQREHEQALIEAVRTQRSGTAAVLSATNLERMLQKAVPSEDTPDVDIDGFLSEVQSDAQDAASRTREAAEVSQNFDLEAFLTEVYG